MVHKATMYQQGNGWIVSYWDEHYQSYVLTGELPYPIARQMVGTANCRHKDDGKCQVESHNHG